jgi:hypothetical protein
MTLQLSDFDGRRWRTGDAALRGIIRQRRYSAESGIDVLRYPSLKGDGSG